MVGRKGLPTIGRGPFGGKGPDHDLPAEALLTNLLKI